MKKLISAALCLFLVIPLLMTHAAVNSGGMITFTDVTEKNWFYEPVLYCYQNGLMNGVSETEFSPGTPLTRAMFITVLGRIDNAATSETSDFPDIKKNSYYSGYLGWATENGIIKGYSDGTFGPDRKISRQEAAVAIMRYIDYTGIVPVWDTEAIRSFADQDSIASWSSDFVDSLRVTGIIKGDSSGNFNPTSSLTRAETATIFMRINEMKNIFDFEEPKNISYFVSSDNFMLLGPYMMYYSGSALVTDACGTKVVSSVDGYSLTRDDSENARKILQFYESPPNCFSDNTYIGFDMCVLDIDPAGYPYVRIGYKITGEGTLSCGISSGSRSEILDAKVSGDGYAVYDLSEADIPFGSSEEYVLTFFTGKDSDISLSYLAMFSDMESAESFDSSLYADEIIRKPETEADYTEITDEKIKEYNDMIDQRRDSILNAEDIDPQEISGTCWYISSVNGDDSNDGKSPETPFRTFSMLKRIKAGGAVVLPAYEKGDGIFIERGSVYNALYDDGFFIDDGVTVSAYGEGDKPLFTKALDINGSMDWDKTEYENVYVLDGIPYDETRPGKYDIGNIIFTDKEGNNGWGIKVIPNDPFDPYNSSNQTVTCGYVTNGYEYFYSGGTSFTDPGCLRNNLEFFHNYSEGKLYLYFDKGDPGEYFDKIIVSVNGEALYSDGKNVIVDNIAVKYTGGCGLGWGEAYNVTIQNCDIEWIGGSILGGSTRYGNGFQTWGSTDGLIVRNNYVNQCYDSALTSQGGGVMYNQYYIDNVIEYCNWGFELWNGGLDGAGETVNAYERGNLMRYCGFGFGHQRPLNSKNGSTNCGLKTTVTPKINYVIEDNLSLFCSQFCVSDGDIARGKTKGAIIRNNIFVMSLKKGYALRTRNNLITQAGHVKTLYPFTEQYLRYLVNIGVMTGCEFLYYTDDISDWEAAGVYYE